MSEDNGGSAFPEVFTDEKWSETNMNYKRDVYSAGGMTLRDYFAAKAFERLVQAHIDQSIDDLSKPDIAREAYSYADAMLKARAK